MRKCCWLKRISIARRLPPRLSFEGHQFLDNLERVAGLRGNFTQEFVADAEGVKVCDVCIEEYSAGIRCEDSAQEPANAM